MNNLITLPADIKIIVIEFLSIDDCFSLQEVSRGFFSGIKTSFWSKKLFEKHIQHSEKLLNILKCSDFKVPYYIPSFAEFGNLFNAQALWQGLVNNQRKAFNFFASINNNNEQAEKLVGRIYRALTDPSIPIPAMKRDTQCLATSSEFENFLTELHFEVRPSLGANDKDFLMLRETCDVIREMTAQTKKTTLKSKKIELNRRNSKFSSKYCKRNQRIEKQTGESSAHRRLTAGKIKENRRIKVEGFLGIQGIVKSHCKIIRNYLSSLTEDKIILKEYKRCWKEFTYSMIELNSLMQPYEELLTSKDLPKFYKNGEMTSFWKIMVDSWLSEVYSKVGLKIKASFQNLLTDAITKEVVDNHPHFEHNEKKLRSEVMEFNSLRQFTTASSEKTVSLLKKSFIALSDISLCKSGVNVLDWDCTVHTQPKVKLINFLYPRIKDLLEKTIEVYDKESTRDELSQTLRNIQNIFDEVFNEEVGLQEQQGDGKELSVDKTNVCQSIDYEEKVNDFHMIAGQYKIISKCKWENRLSQIYPGTESLVCC